MVKIGPSTLPIDTNNIKEEIIDLERAGADYIHLDIMDGEFVENETLGVELLEAVNSSTNILLCTHLMVENPEKWIEEFSETDIFTFHIEAVTPETAESIIQEVHEREMKAGIAIKPDTSIDEIMPYIDEIDMVLVMLVEPGMYGQKMMPECLEKVKILREMRPELDIEVDGGINLENIEAVKAAGATMIVSGKTIVKATDRAWVISQMKK